MPWHARHKITELQLLGTGDKSQLWACLSWASEHREAAIRRVGKILELLEKIAALVAPVAAEQRQLGVEGFFTHAKGRVDYLLDRKHGDLKSAADWLQLAFSDFNRDEAFSSRKPAGQA